MFVNRFTGEVFDDYDDYVEKMKFYLARQWSCKYTGQSGLTFEEALQSEAKAGLYVEGMPGTHVRPALEIVHHNTLNADQLVKRIISTFTAELVPGEQVKVGEDDYIVVGSAAAEQEAAEGEGEKNATDQITSTSNNSNKKFKLIGKGGEVANKMLTLAKELIKRPKHPLNKPMVRSWLYTVASVKVVYDNQPRGARKKNAWFAFPELAKEFSLSDDLPAGLSFKPAQTKKALEAKARAEANLKRKLERAAAKEEAVKKLKREKEIKDEEREKEREKKKLMLQNTTTLKKGSMKYAAYQVLKNVGSEGLSVVDIMQRATEAGLRDFSSTHAAYNKVFGCLCSAPKLFIKVDRGIFALRQESEADLRIIEGAPRTPDERETKMGFNKENTTPPRNTGPRETHMVKVAKAAVCKCEEKVAKAEEVFNEITNTIEQHAKERPRKIEIPSELQWNPELETFTGNSYDRKAIMTHRKWVEEEKSRLAHEAELFVKSRRQEYQKAKSHNKNLLIKATSDLNSAKDNLKKAQKALNRAQSLSLVKSGNFTPDQLTKDKDLQKELEREKLAEERRRKKLEEKEKARLQREKEREERLRMKEVEKLEKKFPLEDNLLVTEIMKLKESNLPVDLPLALPVLEDDVDPTFVQVCIITACLSTFGKLLGMQPMKFHEVLQAVKLPGPTLAGLYRDLLSVLLLDGSQHPSGLRRIRRWVYAMTSEWGSIAWPDVLSRYVLAKPYVDEKVRRAAEELQEKEYQSISYEDHAHLLQFLLDDIVETKIVHEEIDKWQEERVDFVSQKREDKMEMRRKERERQEAVKEKRRKEEEEKKKRREEFEKLKEEKREKGEDVSQMELDEVEEDEEIDEEERFQIPEEKLEFKGNENDRKAVLAHRRWIETEKARLQREYEAYNKEKQKKQREISAKLKEERKVLEAEALAHSKRQEVFDRELAKRPVRMNPMGMDRNKCKYYWNVAGQKAAVYAQNPDNGDWKCFSDETTFDRFLHTLDPRGKRELNLSRALYKQQSSIRSGFRQEREGGKGGKGSSLPTRTSSRLTSTSRVNSSSRLSMSSDGDRMESEDVMDKMESIALMAEKSGINYINSEGESVKWKTWFQEMSDVSPTACLLSLENAIWSSYPNQEEEEGGNGVVYKDPTAQDQEQMDHSSSDEEVERYYRSKLIWFSNRERESWRTMVEKTKTVSALAYCASTLSQRLSIVQRK